MQYQVFLFARLFGVSVWSGSVLLKQIRALLKKWILSFPFFQPTNLLWEHFFYFQCVTWWNWTAERVCRLLRRLVRVSEKVWMQCESVVNATDLSVLTASPEIHLWLHSVSFWRTSDWLTDCCSDLYLDTVCPDCVHRKMTYISHLSCKGYRKKTFWSDNL